MMYLLLDEPVVAVIAIISLAACAYTWVRFKEYQALGWACVSVAVAAAYIWIAVADPPDVERRVIIRIMWVATLLVITYWRVHFAVRQHLSEKR